MQVVSSAGVPSVHSQPCTRSSQELLTQRSFLYNCLSFNEPALLASDTPPSSSVPSFAPASLMSIAALSPSLFMSWYQRSHVCWGWRGECLSERESQLQRGSVCMQCVCVGLCEIDGAGEERRHTGWCWSGCCYLYNCFRTVHIWTFIC